MGDAAHSKKLVDELNLGVAKATAAQRGHLNIPAGRNNRSLVGRLLYHSLDDPRMQCDTGLVGRESGEALKPCGLADADHAADDESKRSVSCHKSFWVATRWSRKLCDKLALLLAPEKASSTL